MIDDKLIDFMKKQQDSFTFDDKKKISKSDSKKLEKEKKYIKNFLIKQLKNKFNRSLTQWEIKLIKNKIDEDYALY